MQIQEASTIRFSSNQGTCDTGILGGRTLQPLGESGGCGFGDQGGEEIEFCLSGSPLSSGVLQGIIAHGSGGSAFAITTCSRTIEGGCGDNTTLYFCEVDGTYSQSEDIERLSCTDNTTITRCALQA